MTTIYVKEKDKLPKRHKNDLYRTERSLIREAIEIGKPRHVDSILDIGAGDGRWGEIAAYMTGARTVVGVEIEDQPKPAGFTDWHCPQDFLTWETTQRFDFIVSNPPFFCAEKIIRKAWPMLAPGGHMVMLLRLAFQSSISRYKGLWVEIPPVEVAVCSRRPSFYGNSTNATDFGVYIWRKDEFGLCSGSPRHWLTTLLNYKRENTRCQPDE